MPPLDDEAEVLDREETLEVEAGAAAEGEAGEAAVGEAGEDTALTVQFGDEAPEPDEAAGAPEWVKDLRKQSREKDRRIKELESQLTGKKTEEQLGPKPTLESCDYDEAAFETALATWQEQKRAADEAEAAAKDEQAKADERWQAKLERLNEQKRQLNVPDYDDAEEFVKETFSTVQQGIVIQGAKNPALLAYALAKNPTKAKELAAITDPIEFAFAVANMEATLKVTKKTPPPPEGQLRGDRGTGGAVDGTLERLRKEAEKTGDYTKVTAYKRSKKA